MNTLAPKKPRKLLVTYALPYANGSIHLGHMVGFIQTDIWVRFQKMQGNQCHYICGDDTHGTPIMIKAQEQGITPEALIAATLAEHKADLAGFDIEFDNFYTTHSEENRLLSETIYQRLVARGDISERVIKQAYDPRENMFLPDRFVKGQCPKCKALDQYGDNCEVCGATYAPTELINPTSILSGATPIEKESEHSFFELPHYQVALREWTQNGHLQPQISHKLNEWLDSGLKAWDISRDAPYFGFTIPGKSDKFFYVWLDAPVGYMASFQNLCARSDLNFDDYWGKEAQTELYHFIGKDIIYFHALFWPAMLQGADFRTPTAIFAHGFLTVEGQKMSKSRGTFINARTYLKHLNPELLRYYFATKLNGQIDDLDFNLADFTQRTNSDLVGKLVNIASRCARFINQHFDNRLADELPNNRLYDDFITAGEQIAADYEQLDYSRVVRRVMELADQANQYIDEKKPWQLIKNPENIQEVQAICTLGLNCFRLLITYLKPIVPRLALAVEQFLQIPAITWDNRLPPLLSQPIATFQPLLTRLTLAEVENIVQPTEAKKPLLKEKTVETTNPTAESKVAEFKPTISIDDFNKIDLRVAKVIAAEEVPEANKLVKLQLDLGDSQRQVFAGIKSGYSAESLLGKSVVMVANLAPRQMRFGLSEGMILAASQEAGVWVICPDTDLAQPGTPVK